MAEAARAGFRSVVNNRPDFEDGPTQPTTPSIEAAARAAGLDYAFLPVARAYQSPEEIAALRRAARRPAQADPRVLPLRRALGHALCRPPPALSDAVRRPRARRARARAPLAQTRIGAPDRLPRIGGASQAAVAARGEHPHFPEALGAPAHPVAADRSLQRIRRPLGRLAGPRRGADQRRQRHRAQGVQHQLERLPRDPVVPVRRRCSCSPPATRCCARSTCKIDVISGRFSKRTQIWIEVIGLCVLRPAAGLHRDPARRAAGDQGLRDERVLVQRRRPDPLAGVRAGAARLRAARPAGGVGADQADRLPARA